MKRHKERSETIAIEFDKKHLSVLISALETYSRLQSGQIKMAMDEVYWDRDLTYDEGQSIESVVRYIAFPPNVRRECDSHSGFYDQYNNEYDESGKIVKESEDWENKKIRPHIDHPNSSFGVGCKEMTRGTIAWEIKKTIDQYLHYQRNEGYRKICDVSGDGALHTSKIPIPKIIENNGYWKPQKSFLISKRYQKDIETLIKTEKHNDVWSVIDKAFKKKPLPRGRVSRIEKCDDSYYVVVEEPYKID